MVYPCFSLLAVLSPPKSNMSLVTPVTHIFLWAQTCSFKPVSFSGIQEPPRSKTTLHFTRVPSMWNISFHCHSSLSTLRSPSCRVPIGATCWSLVRHEMHDVGPVWMRMGVPSWAICISCPGLAKAVGEWKTKVCTYQLNTIFYALLILTCVNKKCSMYEKTRNSHLNMS